jgi:cyclopropane fatty-acyl-phospholipid synthase-like methyltransferase
VFGKPELLDWTALPTTPDQSEIEEVLATLPIDGAAIFHAGIGNSSFAKRFAARSGRIVGCTLSEGERALAQRLGIANYRVHLLNKYSPRFSETVGGGFDLIVDNNLASYACCRAHYHRMLRSYVQVLQPGGRILTHLTGMRWSVGFNPARSLSFEDLESLAADFPLRASRVTERVFFLARV